MGSEMCIRDRSNPLVPSEQGMGVLCLWGFWQRESAAEVIVQPSPEDQHAGLVRAVADDGAVNEVAREWLDCDLLDLRVTDVLLSQEALAEAHIEAPVGGWAVAAAQAVAELVAVNQGDVLGFGRDGRGLVKYTRTGGELSKVVLTAQAQGPRVFVVGCLLYTSPSPRDS